MASVITQWTTIPISGTMTVTSVRPDAPEPLAEKANRKERRRYDSDLRRTNRRYGGRKGD